MQPTNSNETRATGTYGRTDVCGKHRGLVYGQIFFEFLRHVVVSPGPFAICQPVWSVKAGRNTAKLLPGILLDGMLGVERAEHSETFPSFYNSVLMNYGMEIVDM